MTRLANWFPKLWQSGALGRFRPHPVTDELGDPQAVGNPANIARRLWIATAIIVPLLAVPPLFRILFQRQLIIDKLQRSEEECNRADENLLLAMATLGDRIDRLGLESDALPKVELAFYKSVYDQTASEPAGRFAIAMARRRAGVIYLKLHEPHQAQLCFALAIHMLETLAVEKPEPEQAGHYRRILAETYTDDAEYQATIGDTAAAEADYAAALSWLSKQLEKWPDADDLVADQARVWHARGAMFARLNRYPDAEADLNRALAVRLQRSYGPSESCIWLGSPGGELTSTWLALSDVYCKNNRPGDAISVLNQAIAAFDRFGRYKADVHYREECAEAWEKLQGLSANAIGELAQKYPEVAAFRKPSGLH